MYLILVHIGIVGTGKNDESLSRKLYSTECIKPFPKEEKKCQGQLTKSSIDYKEKQQ